MNAALMKRHWDTFRMAHGIALRAVATLPADALDAHPIPGMRTPKELVVHMYGMVGAFPTDLYDYENNEPAYQARLQTNS